MQDLIGRALGHYRIVDKIGEGGMGEVYRAHDERLDRDVAVKVLPEEVAQKPDRLVRFEREAKALAALNHPNIATVHGFERAVIPSERSESRDPLEQEIDPILGHSPERSGDPSTRPSNGLARDDREIGFLVMELLDGETLRERLEGGALGWRKAAEVGAAIADGLAAAHRAGIVHRDLKPENVYLTSDGRVKILDFGLAKLQPPEVELTTTTPTATLGTVPGGMLGTVAYMAPEQLQGRAADRRSDIFALGVVLYEMLTGSRPFAGATTAEVAAEIIKTDPAPIAASLPPGLEPVVAKCLEKRPEDRFSSAHDLALNLGRFGSAITSSSTRERTFVGRRWPHVAAVAVAAVIAAVFVLPPENLFERPEESHSETTVPRIVVLPFENLGDPGDDYFADGITEELISRLAAVSGLQVISRTSAMQYKDSGKAIRQIGEELNVQYALEGSVRWEHMEEGHGLVRITPQLIKVSDDSHLWSDRYDRAIESVFEVQSDIAQQVVRQLHITILEPERRVLDTEPTDNPEAYEAYLRGMHNSTINDFDQNKLAVTMFERAVELDPEFAVAWAALSQLHAYIYHSGNDRTPGRCEAARRTIDRAIERDPDLPTVQLCLGYYYYYCERDYERALVEFSRILAVKPNDPGALGGRAYVLRRQGRWEEAVRLLEQVLEMSPRDAEVAYNLSNTLDFLRNYRRAEEYADLAITLAPDRVDGYIRKLEIFFLQGRWRDAWAVYDEVPTSFPNTEIMRYVLQFAERRYEEALATLDAIPDAVLAREMGERAAGLRAMFECDCRDRLGDPRGRQEVCGRARVTLEELVGASPDNDELHAWLGSVYAALGRRDDAIREGERALKVYENDALSGTSLLVQLAEIYARVGELDAALDRIEHLLSNPSTLTIGFLREHPVWDPLRDHPRFRALLEKYGTS